MSPRAWIFLRFCKANQRKPGKPTTKKEVQEIQDLNCLQAISQDPDASEKFRGGKEGAINALKGAVMKATRGQANPKIVDETLRRLLSS